MGFATLIDILGSTMIGGTILLILFRMNDATVENHYLNSGELIVQSNLLSTVELFEHDLRKIGYCKEWEKIPDPTIAILHATESSISFLTDVAPNINTPLGDGNVDTLKYWIGSHLDPIVLGTPNPRDRMLYRQVNNQIPHSANLGITQFELTYFDALGNKIASLPSNPPLGIITMQIDITVENTAAYGDEDSQNVYSKDKSAFWRQIRLAAPSLSNR
jgi:type II secretory pathway component PulJ